MGNSRKDFWREYQMAYDPFEEQKRAQAAEMQLREYLRQYQNALGVANPLGMGLGLGSLYPGSALEYTPSPTVDPAKLDALKKAEPRKVGRKVPDGITPITTWRAWAAHSVNGEWRLKALGRSELWEPKKRIEATCGKGQSHPAPQKECECGIWAFTTLDELLPAASGYTVKVFGEVSLWGRIVETTKGFRAQYAYPKELWLLDNSLEELGYIYGVPIRTS